MAAVEEGGEPTPPSALAAAQGLKRLGEEAGRGGQANEETHKRRVRALATLPCGRLGCARVQRPGEAKQPSKRCSDCFKATFCSALCRRRLGMIIK